MSAPAARRALPLLAPITPAALARFDVSESAPAALAVLRRALGLGATVRVVAHLARRGIFADPLRALGPPEGLDEALTRQQLRAVLLLDDALRVDLGLETERARALLREVVLASGALFLARFQPSIAPEDWTGATPAERETFARRLVSRLFNARVDRVEAWSDALIFDVGACRFVKILSALGRPELAPLFCEVDSAFVSRTGSRLTLERASTLAHGAPRCDFRFSMRAPE